MPNKKNSKKARVSAAAKPVQTRAMPSADSSRFALYVYWFIILFFVSATFYILGRSYSIVNPPSNNASISESFAVNMANLSPEERASMAKEYLESGQEKLFQNNISAISDLTMSIDAEPSVLAYIYRGEAFMAGAQYDNALADFTNAARMDPENPVPYYDGALVYMRLEKFDDARAALGIALEMYQRNPSEYLNRHDIYAKRATVALWAKDWAAAANDYSSAIEISSKKDYLDFAGRAEAFTGMGQFQAAATDYLTAITIISETIGDVPAAAEREDMSRNAMAYFEKSGALHVALNDMEAARADLNAAFTLASSLNDVDAAARFRDLIEKM